VSGVADADLPETAYGSQDDSQSVSSKHLQLLAMNIRQELEQIIQKYNVAVVAQLIPLVASALETLDETDRRCQEMERERDRLCNDHSDDSKFIMCKIFIS